MIFPSLIKRFPIAVLGLTFSVCAFATNEFPNKPIRIVVSYAAGGPTDVAARAVAQSMSATLGQPVIVENKPGAATSIAAAYVAQQPKDGYTLLVHNNQTNSNPLMYSKLPYKLADFTPVGLMYTAPPALVVSPNLPVKNVKELIAYAKARPGEINYGTLGAGGSPHISAVMFEKFAGISMTGINYPGAAQAAQDLMAGRVHLMFTSASSAIPLHQSGRLRVLGIGSDVRYEIAPDIPTLKEQGLPVVLTTWFGLVAPAGTPADRIEVLNAAVRKAVNSPEFKEKMRLAAAAPAPSSAAEFGAFMKEDYDRWSAVVKPMNLQLD